MSASLLVGGSACAEIVYMTPTCKDHPPALDPASEGLTLQGLTLGTSSVPPADLNVRAAGGREPCVGGGLWRLLADSKLFTVFYALHKYRCTQQEWQLS